MNTVTVIVLDLHVAEVFRTNTARSNFMGTVAIHLTILILNKTFPGYCAS